MTMAERSGYIRQDYTQSPETDWIPGGVGYIRSEHPDASGLTAGEYLVYLGGGRYYGLGGGIRYLEGTEGWLNHVQSWYPNSPESGYSPRRIYTGIGLR